MKMFNTIIASMALSVAASCSAVNPPEGYTVVATLTADADGATAYIVDYDNGAKLDSCIVADGVARFSGKLDKPAMVRLIVGGQRCGSFILEPGEIKVAEQMAAGTPLNEIMDDLDKKLNALQARYQALPQDSTTAAQREAIITRYDQMIDSVMESNIDNPIGYYLFLQKGYEMTLPEMEQAIAAHPSLGEYTRVQKLIEAGRNKERTSVGQKMVDFTIGDQKLSDYVGNGKYVLVDFWASWCGPCRREIKTIKKILSDSDPERFEVLGVAVWDKPEDTREAIEKLQIPWAQIIDAQSVPTDLYGISGIPCIILFGPDGTILSRDKQGADLESAVREALAK